METYFDIETIPGQPESEHKAIIAETITPPAAMKQPKTIADWHNGEGKYKGAKEVAIKKAYRDQSFDGAKGEIITMAFAVETYKEINVRKFQRNIGESEKEMISDFFACLTDDLNGRPGLFIGHRVAAFDMRFLFRRCVILGIKPPFKIKFDGRQGVDYYDNMIGWCGYKDTISQDSLAKCLGLKGKPGHIDGSKVWDYAKEGRIDEIAEYNADDVEQCREIYKRITFKNY